MALDLYRTGLQTLVPSKLGSSEASTSRVKVVFLLSLSGRAVGQVLRLIRRLDGPGSYFYVHVDARQDYMHRELSRLVGSKENVRLASRRFITIWGGASLLSMLLSSFEELLSMSDWNWDFVLNLSESDYPIKSRLAIFKEYLVTEVDRYLENMSSIYYLLFVRERMSPLLIYSVFLIKIVIINIV